MKLRVLLRIAGKIFADSSFYDDPEHKYPTIEEQIKMARKVAQSLTATGNVKARGQRMFLRRREKADQWVADAFGPRHGHAVRRVAAARAAAAAAELSEMESEMPYYNPAPWTTTVGRSPWAEAGGGAPSTTITPWMPKPVDTSGSRWQPVRHVQATPPMPKHSGNVPPQVAFGLAKDLSMMQDRGGRMFAKMRERAAVEETENYTSEVERGDVMRRIADSYVPPQPAAWHDVVDNGVGQHASANRLIEKIERSRATTGGPTAAHPVSG